MRSMEVERMEISLANQSTVGAELAAEICIVVITTQSTVFIICSDGHIGRLESTIVHHMSHYLCNVKSGMNR